MEATGGAFRSGGIGKSQLAIEYAYRAMDQYDLIWFFSAEDGFGAREMLARLGSRLRIQPRDRERTVISVLRVLEDTDLRWLLIFDNATPDIPIDAPVARWVGGLAGWRVGGSAGRRVGDIIVTTRASEWKTTPVHFMPVDMLARDESVRFLCVADPEISATAADSLADMLGDLPLALAQLAATRKATGMRSPGVVRVRALREARARSPPSKPPSTLIRTPARPGYRANVP